jgi:ABC-type transporter Mla maintaining outer membrane lipid asymmetry ATPase subunit MlaF
VFGGLALGSCHFGGACFGRPSLGTRLDDVDPNFGDCEQIRVLIMDEPTASIDAENEQMLYELLYQLNKEKNLTIIMVTHSIEDIEESMNKVYVVQNKTVSRRK